jgi:hypothetical protein
MCGTKNITRVIIHAADQRGIVLLFSLLMTILVSMLAIAAISAGLMAAKINHFDGQAEQAQMACDGGVDWVMELISEELNQTDNLMTGELPIVLICSDQNMSLLVEDAGCNVSVGPITRKVSPWANACTYEFIITATYESACKKVKIQSTHAYNGGYVGLDGNGNTVFVPRTFTDRGRVTSYQPSY